MWYKLVPQLQRRQYSPAVAFFFHIKFQHYKLPTEKDENHSSSIIPTMQEISNAATSPFSFERMSLFNDVSIANDLSLLI